jgi:hypothetical protein
MPYGEVCASVIVRNDCAADTTMLAMHPEGSRGGIVMVVVYGSRGDVSGEGGRESRAYFLHGARVDVETDIAQCRALVEQYGAMP